MKVFNHYFPIHDREKHIITEEQLEKFDEMLNQYSIPHAFVEYHESQEDTVSCNLLCMEENVFEVKAIGMLWSKIYRGFTDDEMNDFIKRMAIRLTEE